MSQFVGQCKQRIARYEFLGFLTIFWKQATFENCVVERLCGSVNPRP